MRLKKLLLFDIDGTLVDTGGTGFPALQQALTDSFGIVDDLSYVQLAGATDTNIAREILVHHQIEPSPGNIAKYIDSYLQHLKMLMPQKQGYSLPGVVTLMEELKKRSHLVLALLTGNVVRGAEIKLAHYGLWHFFEFGAFADDHHVRDELGPFAKARALEKHGIEFAAEDIFVIGDTPKDIACGRAIGAKAVAVATGQFTREQLAACSPDFLFENFEETEKTIATLDW